MDPLAEIGRSISGILSGTKSASESRRDIRAALAAADYEPTGSGIKDHTTQKRLDLILQQNVRAARGYARRREGMDPDTLDLWPAQELVRVYGRKVPRDWKARFVESGGNLVSGRMIALKTSPVWMSLSRFGVPWPPFDFGSGMGVRDISRKGSRIPRPDHARRNLDPRRRTLQFRLTDHRGGCRRFGRSSRRNPQSDGRDGQV